MKKILSILLIFAMLFSLCACNSSNQTTNPSDYSYPTTSGIESTTSNTEAPTDGTGDTNGVTQPTNDSTTPPTNEPTTAPTTTPTTPPTEAPTTPLTTQPATCSHNWKDATCIVPKTCSICGTTTGSTTQHTYNTQGQCIYCETINPVLVNKYEQAVAIVARCTSSAAQSGADLEKAYKLFVELGDFKDAKEYLSHFSCTSALMQTNQTAVNAFGEPMSPFVADNTRSTYNSLGQLIELYDGFFTIQYTYKENGLLDKEAYKIGGAQNSTSFIVQHIYDANGKQTHITRTTSSGDTETRALTYDNNGRLVSTYEFTSSLIGSFRYVNYQYDQFNRVIKKTTEIGNYTYEYTYSGEKIDECKIASKNDKYYDVVKYYYDEDRLVKTESTYHSEDGTKGRVITTLYTYGDVYIYRPSR